MNATGRITPVTSDYQHIEHAIDYLQRHVDRQPGMDELATELGMSRHHFQRLFRRWAGVSPKRFLECLSVDHARCLLAAQYSVMDAAHRLGMSGPARLHDQFVAIEAMTPGEYKGGGEGLTIGYGIHDSPFGDMLIAQTARGICWLSFPPNDFETPDLEPLQHAWPRATLVADPDATAATAARVFAHARGGKTPLALAVHGTNFQVNVWKALLRIPPGALVSYSGLARDLGSPRATRAVATAVARNPVAWLIPCHRVIRATGVIGEYHWGASRKRLMLAREAAQKNAGLIRGC
jgi:AraC family transcriptional regulator of adaptative response/methylated-DNA-[protein]-cysteine methyltransferase